MSDVEKTVYINKLKCKCKAEYTTSKLYMLDGHKIICIGDAASASIDMLKLAIANSGFIH